MPANDGDYFLSIPQRLNVSALRLAEVMWTNERTMRRWLADTKQMPPNVRMVLQFFVMRPGVFELYCDFADAMREGAPYDPA